jgi:uncharacterized protein YwgA
MKQVTCKKDICVIPADVFRRIYLFTIIGKFDNGVYGAKRLQKVTYISERSAESPRPFTYKKYHYGQFSDQVQNTKEQLISLGFVKTVPLDTSRNLKINIADTDWEFQDGGNRYVACDKDNLLLYESIASKSYPKLMELTNQVINNYGYLKEPDLISRCYDFEEFKNKNDGEVIYETNLPEWVQVPGLSNDDCEDLILSFTPSFIDFARKITDGLERTTIDWENIEKVVLKV